MKNIFTTVSNNGYTFQNFTEYKVDPNTYFTSDPTQYIITQNDIGRLDEVALKLYGNREYYRYIMLYNYLEDPFNDLTVGLNIRIPNIEDIKAYESDINQYNKWTDIEDQTQVDKWK